MTLNKIILTLLTSSIFLSSGLFAKPSADEITAAQEKLEEAVREYTELTTGLKENNTDIIVRSFGQIPKATNNRARLGIHIGKATMEKNAQGKSAMQTSNEQGVYIFGITEGGPAEAIGLLEGDVITQLNGLDLQANNEQTAIDQLMQAMRKVKPGDSVDLSYKRNGRINSTSLMTDKMPEHKAMVFSDFMDNFSGSDIDIEVFSDAVQLERFGDLNSLGKNLNIFSGKDGMRVRSLFVNASPLGDAELVELSPELGEYFKADKGLLVIRAPTDANTELKAGDVIQSIDGREPRTISDAMRILRSYDAGDVAELRIKRKKRNAIVNLVIAEKKPVTEFDFPSGKMLLKKRDTIEKDSE